MSLNTHFKIFKRYVIKKEEEEYAKYCVEMDKAKKEYLALGGKKFIDNGTGRL